jgi:hypothetical protein
MNRNFAAIATVLIFIQPIVAIAPNVMSGSLISYS